MERAIDSTAKALATIGQHVGSNKEQGPSKSFQMLIKTIGEAKTKHVSFQLQTSAAVKLCRTGWYRVESTSYPNKVWLCVGMWPMGHALAVTSSDVVKEVSTKI